MTAVNGFVPEVGNKQGEPLSMLLMAVVMMMPLQVDEMIRHKGTLHAGVENGHNGDPQHMAVHGVSRLLGARGYADDVWLHGDAEVLLRHLDDVKDIILTTTGMELTT